MRLDLDELRANARVSASAKGSTLLSREASGSDVLPASLSRNLGRELSRRLQLANTEGESADSRDSRDDKKNDGEDSYEEEIITTRRRLASIAAGVINYGQLI